MAAEETTIAKALNAKAELERSLREQLLRFYEDTGLTVSGIAVTPYRLHPVGENKPRTVSVDVELHVRL